MRVLVTGVAGFIGFHLSKKLLEDGNKVVGIDNINNYYDVKLKKARLQILKSEKLKRNFLFFKGNIENKEFLKRIFKKNKFDFVIHLAAQAGVRYSLEKPKIYMKSNIDGFFNILENIRYHKNNLIFASSSSVYGKTNKKVFVESDICNKPKQLYAATKLANESMAFAYHDLFNINMICLRFFTVYGPYGRPDMSIFKFTKDFLSKKTIKIYNHGNHTRDYTYISDAVQGIINAMKKYKKNRKKPIFQTFNIGNNKPQKLLHVVKTISKILKIKPHLKFINFQAGDMKNTSASITKAQNLINYKPKTKFFEGVKKFIDWYQLYYK